jgi:hypothetical protein
MQQRVARLVATLPEADQFALAGGATLVLAGIVDRETRDLDFFGPSCDDVDVLADVFEAALIEQEWASAGTGQSRLRSTDRIGRNRRHRG